MSIISLDGFQLVFQHAGGLGLDAAGLLFRRSIVAGGGRCDLVEIRVEGDPVTLEEVRL